MAIVKQITKPVYEITLSEEEAKNLHILLGCGVAGRTLEDLSLFDLKNKLQVTLQQPWPPLLFLQTAQLK